MISIYNEVNTWITSQVTYFTPHVDLHSTFVWQQQKRNTMSEHNVCVFLTPRLFLLVMHGKDLLFEIRHMLHTHLYV